jgi:hypothetical protein
MEMSWLQWCICCSNIAGSSEQMGSIGWCVNGVLASAPMGTVFDCEISGSHGIEYEDESLLGYSAM